MTSGGYMYMYVPHDVKLHIQLSFSKFKMSMNWFFFGQNMRHCWHKGKLLERFKMHLFKVILLHLFNGCTHKSDEIVRL